MGDYSTPYRYTQYLYVGLLADEDIERNLSWELAAISRRLVSTNNTLVLSLHVYFIPCGTSWYNYTLLLFKNV